jgi:predicted RNA-binding Zn-ribbon protein involved in translation (DUF1610 family)
MNATATVRVVYPVADGVEIGSIIVRDGRDWKVETVFYSEEDGYTVKLAECRDYEPFVCPNCGSKQIQRPAFHCLWCAVELNDE